jgi:hypothetical protein
MVSGSGTTLQKVAPAHHVCVDAGLKRPAPARTPSSCCRSRLPCSFSARQAGGIRHGIRRLDQPLAAARRALCPNFLDLIAAGKLDASIAGTASS